MLWKIFKVNNVLVREIIYFVRQRSKNLRLRPRQREERTSSLVNNNSYLCQYNLIKTVFYLQVIKLVG